MPIHASAVVQIPSCVELHTGVSLRARIPHARARGLLLCFIPFCWCPLNALRWKHLCRDTPTFPLWYFRAHLELCKFLHLVCARHLHQFRAERLAGNVVPEFPFSAVPMLLFLKFVIDFGLHDTQQSKLIDTALHASARKSPPGPPWAISYIRQFLCDLSDACDPRDTSPWYLVYCFILSWSPSECAGAYTLSYFMYVSPASFNLLPHCLQGHRRCLTTCPHMMPSAHHVGRDAHLMWALFNLS